MPSLPCPKCRQLLAIPTPMPEQVVCFTCGGTFKLKVNAPAKAAPPLAAIHVPQEPATAAWPAATIAPATAGLAPGTAPKMVAGLEIIRELARGGLGVVYLARHPQFLDNFRAIKRPLSGDGLERDILLARFRREVQAVGALKHDHIVRALDAGADAEGPYLVTEYLDGEPLSRLLTYRGKLPVAEACELIRQAAQGLQAAHERGLIHRDLKPSNLMLARANSAARVVIIDWGLAKKIEANAPAGEGLTRHAGMGTPDFIAPEQIADASGVDIRADIYSLGATLHCLLAGVPPFHGRRDTEKYLAHEREAFPPLGADVPRGLSAVLQKMADKEPGRRFATPAEVAQALQPFCSQDPRRLLALLDAPRQQPLPVTDTKDVLNQKTELATPSGMAAGYPPISGSPTATSRLGPVRALSSRLRLGMFIAGATGLLLLGLVAGLALRGKDQDKDQEIKPDAPKSNPAKSDFLLNEDFAKAYEKKATLPDGWKSKSDAYRVVLDNERPCLEVSLPTGVHSVSLPPFTLSGNFKIEGEYLMDWVFTPQKIGILLEASKGGAPLLVAIEFNGNVAINSHLLTAPPSYKTGPTHFMITREGKKIVVRLNTEPIGEKILNEATDYDMVSLSLSANVGNTGRKARLYKLKIANMPK